jgi:hypothetical protein
MSRSSPIPSIPPPAGGRRPATHLGDGHQPPLARLCRPDSGLRRAGRIPHRRRAFEAAASAINREARENRVDVVVAGGSNGAYLRQHVDVPVVLVKVTGFDVMSALATARRISPKVALVTHASTYAEVDEFVRAFGLDIPRYTYLTEDDATARVRA